MAAGKSAQVPPDPLSLNTGRLKTSRHPDSGAGNRSGVYYHWMLGFVIVCSVLPLANHYERPSITDAPHPQTLVAEFSEDPDFGCVPSHLTPVRIPSDAASAKQTWSLESIKSGSVIVIGSSDTSADRHHLELRFADSQLEMSADQPKLTIEKFKEAEFAAIRESAEHRMTRPCLRKPGQPFSIPCTLGDDDVYAECPPQPPLTRNFSVPVFTGDAAACKVTHAELVANNDLIAVYATAGISDSSVCRTAHHICHLLAAHLLPRLREQLCEITDVDGDQRLTIVIAQLDQRVPVRNKICKVPRIQGCVKRDDFTLFGEADQASRRSLEQNDFFGDIIYLDQVLPFADDLAALLMHELTHAAIYSRQTGSKSQTTIPIWLNEALAHQMELSVVSDSSNYHSRRQDFAASPNSSPVMIPDHGESLATRRGGARVAGTEFLRSLRLSSDQTLQLLDLDDPAGERISRICGIPFEQLFRRWSVQQALDLVNSTSEADQQPQVICLHQGAALVELCLRGTAFTVFTAGSDLQRLVISTDEHCELQVSVVEKQTSGQ